MPRRGRAAPLLRDSSDTLKPLTARPRTKGSHGGRCPQGSEGCRLRVPGSGQQCALISSAPRPAGPSCAVGEE